MPPAERMTSTVARNLIRRVGAVAAGLLTVWCLTVLSTTHPGWYAGLGWAFRWTCGSLVLQLALVAPILSSDASNVKRVRSASDATWYIPVYIWALESAIAAGNYSVERAPISWSAIPSGVMLVFTLVSCTMTERWAKRSGTAARTDLGASTIPCRSGNRKRTTRVAGCSRSPDDASTCLARRAAQQGDEADEALGGTRAR